MKSNPVSRRNLLFDGLLIGLIILEISCIFFFPSRGFIHRQVNALTLFAASLLFGILLIAKYYRREVSLHTVRMRGSRRRYILTFALFLAGFAGLCILLKQAFITFPVNPKDSDVIPTVQMMVQRFLNGVYPYKPFTDWGYYFEPTYLPMHWMPYVVPEVLHFDYRWMAAGIWLLGSCLLLWRTVLITGYVRSSFVALLLLYALWNIAMFNNGVLGMTIELMVAGYYMLFIIGLNKNNPWLKGLFITFCLLSRYSLVLWLPLWVFVELVSGNRRQLLLAMGTIAVLVTVLYFIPFLSKDWGSFFRGYNYYSKAAMGEWTHIDYQGRPMHLYGGVGFARYFYEYGHGPIADRIKLLQKVHLFLSLGSVVVMGAWYWACRRYIHYRIFLLASFKIYLVFFLSFIQVPYIYLMVPAVFVSIAIFSEQLRYKALPVVNALIKPSRGPDELHGEEEI